MDIRTRLSLFLVAVSLISMMLLGTFAYYTSAGLLQEISLRQLDALAESKKRDLNKVYEAWEDMLRLVRSRVQLSQSIRDYVEKDSPDALHSIERIIQGITVALPEIDKLIVYDPDGNEIASAGRTKVLLPATEPGDDVAYIGTFQTDDGLRVAMNSGLELDGAPVGGISVIFDAGDVIDVTSDYTGLGETGEALVIMREEERLTVLNPVRYEIDEFTGEELMTTASTDMSQAFQPDEISPAVEHTDYRGEKVWLATRFLERPGWGLVVKVDVSEEEKRADVLQDALFDIAVALSAFAIIGGALLGFYLARPIHELAVVVERMRHGERGLRAEVKGDDEITYLSEALNEFLDHLEDERSAGDSGNA